MQFNRNVAVSWKKIEPLILSPGSAGDWENNNRRQDDRGYTGKE